MHTSVRYADKLEAELFHEVKPTFLGRLFGQERGRRRWDRTRTRVVPDKDSDDDDDALWDSDSDSDSDDDMDKRRQQQQQQQQLKHKQRQQQLQMDCVASETQAMYMTTVRKLRQPVQDLRIHTALANVYHKSKPLAASFAPQRFYLPFSRMLLDYNKQQQLQRRPACRYLMMLLETPTHLVRQNHHPVRDALCRRRRSFADTAAVVMAHHASSSAVVAPKRLKGLSAWSQRVMRRDKHQHPTTVVSVESLVQQRQRAGLQWHQGTRVEHQFAASAAAGGSPVPLRPGWCRPLDDDQDEVPLGLLRKQRAC